ncbi:YcnI family protein [Siccirubricoccus phaeus]|uniref:YcnI family protein n=1 Tax=Siccirubricoccus phaeus TaxID=2595053 RepID=UPI00165CCDAC|nr:YcnI family protein [Siccirubricoccus phaeus]
MRLAIAALAAGLLGPLAAAAHVTVDPAAAPAGDFQRVALRVLHGCGSAATTRIAVELPQGVYTAKPMPKPGWTLRIERRALPHAMHGMHGHETEAEIARITWDGGPLPDEQYDEFVLLLQLPNEPGGTLTLPVTQGCAGGQAEAWVERPAAGQQAEDLARPAPFIRLTPR